MANEIQIRHTETGSSLYAVIRNSANQYWETTLPGFQTLSPGDWHDYEITLTEFPAGGYTYVGTFPAAIGVGLYSVDIYEQAGGSPAITDQLIASGEMNWSGTAEVSVVGIDSLLGNVASDADNIWDTVSPGGDGDLASVKGTVEDTNDDLTVLSVDVDNIWTLVQTGGPGDLAAVKTAVDALNNLSAAQVETAVGNALETYDPPTKAEMDEVVGALNNLSAIQVNAEVDIALADFGGPTNAQLEARTLLSAGYADKTTLDAVDAKTANLPTSPAAVSDIPTVVDVDDKLTTEHGSGSWTGGGFTGEDRTMLEAINAKTVLIGASTYSITSSMARDGLLTIAQGDDHDGDGKVILSITNYIGLSLDGGSAVLRFQTSVNYHSNSDTPLLEVPSSAFTHVGQTVTATFILTAEQTNQLEGAVNRVATHYYHCVATSTGGKKVTLGVGKVDVIRNIPSS